MNNKILKNLILIFIIIIAISAIILPREINNLDEIWNFGFAKNIADGRLPYKDFNLIHAPLLPILCGVFLKIFGTELIVMRILGIILCTSMLFACYKIMELLKINKYVIGFSILGIYLLFYNHFWIDYNMVTLLLVLICLFNEIKYVLKYNELYKERTLKFDLFLGILMGTAILYKQTTGIIISIIFILYKLVYFGIISAKTGYNKQELIKVLNITLARFLGVFIPVLILFLYLVINNIWKDFLDYAIYGLTTFTNHRSYMDLIRNNNFISIMAISIPCLFMYMYYKFIMKKTNPDKMLFILFAYSVATFVIAFPIPDEVHFLIGSIPGVITIIYIMWNRVLEDGKIIPEEKFNQLSNGLKRLSKSALLCVAIGILGYSSLGVFKYMADMNNYTELKNFKYIKSYPETINIIDDFILQNEQEGKKVYILDSTAVLYMIPINKYNKNYDMFLKGNLGAEGEEGQIENLKKEKDCIVLILNGNYGRNWQNPEKVRDYIINNWQEAGEIAHFDIYVLENGE